MRNRLLFYPFAAITAVFLTCTNLGGIGHEGEARISGRVIMSNGTPASQTELMLFPADYDPVKNSSVIPIDTTDALGNYSFNCIYHGDYSILAVHLINRTRALASGIDISGDTIIVPDITLQTPGAIKLMLLSGINGATGYVFIPGTTFSIFLNHSTTFVLLDSVPAGTVPAVSYALTNSAGSTVIRYNVTVSPGDTTVVWNPLWKYARAFVLNTSATGANVTNSVANFPVLIRLNSGNFDFSQAQATGADIRFTKSDNTFLPYEIERWDAVNGQAEIWVRVDTVYGNDSGQAITMYWGNPDAAAHSNGRAVFDTSNGFLGVWHFCENGDSAHDATARAFHGTASGAVAAAGIIGNSRKFADGDFIKIAGLLSSPSIVTLSAWVQSDKSTGNQEVISLGDAVMVRLDIVKGASGWFHNSPITYVDTKYAIAGSGRFLAATGWHFLAFSIDTATHVQTLYIDGEQAAITNDVNPIYYAGLGTDTYIGVHGNGKTGYNFVGQIDEVRAGNVSLGADWIKLCYMNQKAQDALVKW